MAACKWLTTVLHGTANDNRITPLASSSTTCETSLKLGSKKVRRDIDCPSAYEFYTMFRPGNAIQLYEWHVNIPENNNVLKAAQKFHQGFEKLTLSSSIIDKIDIIKETLLKSMPADSACSTIEEYFRDARSNDSPLSILKAYTVAQTFTNRINTVLAENTHHALKLYCTQLNCPILTQTQEYTEAITSIFFHPKLDDLLVRNAKVYRGAVLEDEKLVANWKDGAKIITTTFLSTSTNPHSANKWYDPENERSIFCEYNICNTTRRTALDLTKLSHFVEEEEILILPYVPFTITTKPSQLSDDLPQTIICFEEFKEVKECRED